MKIKKFENYERIDLSVRYEIRYYDNNLQDEVIVGENEYNYNPFDIKDMVELLMKYEKKGLDVYLIRTKEEMVDKKTIEDVKLKIRAEKYNL